MRKARADLSAKGRAGDSSSPDTDSSSSLSYSSYKPPPAATTVPWLEPGSWGYAFVASSSSAGTAGYIPGITTDGTWSFSSASAASRSAMARSAARARRRAMSSSYALRISSCSFARRSSSFFHIHWYVPMPIHKR
jgi:hypothetical protein